MQILASVGLDLASLVYFGVSGGFALGLAVCKDISSAQVDGDCCRAAVLTPWLSYQWPVHSAFSLTGHRQADFGKIARRLIVRGSLFDSAGEWD